MVFCMNCTHRRFPYHITFSTKLEYLGTSGDFRRFFLTKRPSKSAFTSAGGCVPWFPTSFEKNRHFCQKLDSLSTFWARCIKKLDVPRYQFVSFFRSILILRVDFSTLCRPSSHIFQGFAQVSGSFGPTNFLNFLKFLCMGPIVVRENRSEWVQRVQNASKLVFSVQPIGD